MTACAATRASATRRAQLVTPRAHPRSTRAGKLAFSRGDALAKLGKSPTAPRALARAIVDERRPAGT